MITASSSSEGDSSVSIWLSSNFESKKCPDLLSIRSFSNERFPTRWRYKTGRFNSEIKFRYFCLRAEHEITTRLDFFSNAFLIAVNHPFLSLSLRAMPSPILTLFSRGWKSSPSRNGQLRRSARAEPIVLFPHPETPMTTITGSGKYIETGLNSRSYNPWSLSIWLGSKKLLRSLDNFYLVTFGSNYKSENRTSGTLRGTVTEFDTQRLNVLPKRVHALDLKR